METPLNALLASWRNLSLDLERPIHKQISESNCTSYSEKDLVAQTHIFNTIKPLLVLTSSPSRTNTNLNTLQCSFPKPPSKQPLSRPFPRTHPSPQICSATIEKALGLRRWPLQGYDRWSGARSARFLSFIVAESNNTIRERKFLAKLGNFYEIYISDSAIGFLLQ